MIKPDKNIKEKTPRLRKNKNSDIKNILNNAQPEICNK